MAHDPRVRIGVACVLKDEHDRVLLMRRGENATHGAGTWALPGGWVDFGEDPAESAIRELTEEVNLNYPLQPVFETYVWNTYFGEFDVVCLVFHFDVDKIDVSKCRNMEPDKADTLGWFSIHEIGDMKLFPPLESYFTMNPGMDPL